MSTATVRVFSRFADGLISDAGKHHTADHRTSHLAVSTVVGHHLTMVEPVL
jgi:hypothetical protein